MGQRHDTAGWSSAANLRRPRRTNHKYPSWTESVHAGNTARLFRTAEWIDPLPGSGRDSEAEPDCEAARGECKHRRNSRDNPEHKTDTGTCTADTNTGDFKTAGK